MEPTLMVVIGGAVLLAVILRFGLARGGDAAIRRAVKEGDVGPLVEHLGGLPVATQPNAFSDAIQQLWNRYERELALPVICALAERFPEQQISQYWLDQLQRVEPELAAGERDFIRRHYRPEIAATCGRFG
jgi:hypothetical protein